MMNDYGSSMQQKAAKTWKETCLPFFFIRILRSVKIISFILSHVNCKVGLKRKIPEKKTPDQPQAELGLSHSAASCLFDFTQHILPKSGRKGFSYAFTIILKDGVY